MAWVPFNESTGTLSLSSQARQRHYVEGMVLLTRALDETRPVVANDGWEALGGDIVGVHDYDEDPASLLGRYSAADLDVALGRFAGHGRVQILDDPDCPVSELIGSGKRALVLSEFGGIGWADAAPVTRCAPSETIPTGDRLAQPASWGYSTVKGPVELAERYRAFLEAVHRTDRLAGFCYTQLADTYQEVNGLLRGDRTPKVPVEIPRAATLDNPAERCRAKMGEDGAVVRGAVGGGVANSSECSQTTRYRRSLVRPGQHQGAPLDDPLPDLQDDGQRDAVSNG